MISKPFWIILIFAFCTAVKSNAQTQKGNFLLGGSVGIAHSKYESVNSNPVNKQKSFSVDFNPGISYFLMDQLAIGVLIPFSYNQYTSSTTKLHDFTYAFGPRIRYYFPFGPMAIFPEVTGYFGKSEQVGPYFNTITGVVEEVKIRSNIQYLTIGLGTTYFINDNIGLEGVLMYKKENRDYEKAFPRYKYLLG